jgi:competence protein ComEA
MQALLKKVGVYSLKTDKMIKFFVIMFLLVYITLAVFLLFVYKPNNNEINNNATQTLTINIPPTTTTTIEVEKININTCSREALISLPTIGEKIADRIIEYRKIHKFKDIYELDKIKGIGDETIKILKEVVVVK